MFFYEWVVPFFVVIAILATIFYVSARNLPGAGVRTDGRTLFHKPDDDSNPPVG